MEILQIVAAVCIASLGLMAEHWFPWRSVIGRDLPNVACYVLGLLTMMVPTSVLFVLWGEWMSIVVVWVVIAAGGLSVMAAYLIDAWAFGKTEAGILKKQLHRVMGVDDEDC